MSMSREPSSEYKSLPLIVDIALDENGKQLYQMHKTLQRVRKQMPRSTQLSRSIHLRPDALGANRTGYNSCSELAGAIGDFDAAEELGYFSAPGDICHDSTFSRSSSVDLNRSVENDFYTANRDLDTDIWLDDVEAAFEEVLEIIPKNGLSKIKILGRSCGRNELISDFILTKTGKYRTRKQVLSHIQVIKNLGQKSNIIKLINDGPAYRTDQEQLEINRRFESVFAVINMAKSMGINRATSKHKLARSANSSPKRNRRVLYQPKYAGTIIFKAFSISAEGSQPQGRMLLTQLMDEILVNHLQIKEDAFVSLRFPGLSDFAHSANVPIIHNLVKIWLPQVFFMDSIEATFTLGSESWRPSSRLGDAQEYCSFVSIYSCGEVILKFYEADLRLGVPHQFMSNFWRFFLGQFVDKNFEEASKAFRGMSIKQVVYEGRPLGPGNVEGNNYVPRLKIKAVLLWEFMNVETPAEAVTTTSRLSLPSQMSASGESAILSRLKQYTPRHPAPEVPTAPRSRTLIPGYEHRSIVKIEPGIQGPDLSAGFGSVTTTFQEFQNTQRDNAKHEIQSYPELPHGNDEIYAPEQPQHQTPFEEESQVLDSIDFGREQHNIVMGPSFGQEQGSSTLIHHQFQQPDSGEYIDPQLGLFSSSIEQQSSGRSLGLGDSMSVPGGTSIFNTFGTFNESNPDLGHMGPVFSPPGTGLGYFEGF